jgi:peptidyl-prolyl cis-trans isomerase A (cyclophilin A)
MKENKLSLILFNLLLLVQITNVFSQNPRIRFETEVGDIIVEIFIDRAPVTAYNFLRYVDENRFTSATFYRVVRLDNQPNNKIKIEVIQGGLREGNAEKIFPPIKHETTKITDILHKNGVISMARLNPGTATSEFFICIGDQPELDFGGERNPDGQGFASFGKVIEGMEVVKKIQKLPDENQYLINPVKISKIERVK